MECRKWQLCLIAMAALWYCANADCPNGDCDQRHHHHHHDNGTIIGAFMGWSTFSKWGHRRAAGGTLQSRGYSLRDCEAACMKDIPCVAIDYVPWLWECWIYHKVSPVSVLQKDENVNHYRPARCSSSKADPCVLCPCRNGGLCVRRGHRRKCLCRRGYHGRNCQACIRGFARFRKRFAAGGHMNSSINDLKTCKHVCMADMQCVAVDYIMDHQACWLHHDAHALHMLDRDVSVNHYQPIRCGHREDALQNHPCMSSPCENHGTCITVGQKGAFYCACIIGTAGDRCQDKDPCASRPCLNNGTCTCVTVPGMRDYQCKCPDGYSGENCEKYNICRNRPCLHGGICTTFGGNYKCRCLTGYFGENCQEYDPCHENPCHHEGTCIKGHMSYKCKCKPGYHGENCQTLMPCEVRPCQNGGVCEAAGEHFHCYCINGYYGNKCQFCNLCYKRPCKNGGTCHRRGRKYYCLCGKGYHGMNCEKVDLCLRPCKNRGTCYVHHGRRHCRCGQSFYGDNCQYRDPCSTKGLCKNGGTCASEKSQYHCICANGYYSSHCEDYNACWAKPCLHGGTCVDQGHVYMCRCSQGYVGTRCEHTDACHEFPCENNATCVLKGRTRMCKCGQGYTGVDCEKLEQCQSGPCRNNGTCLEFGDKYTCQCVSGFEGATCERENMCKLRPCQNDGTCVMTGSSRQCHCTDTYSGPSCETFNPCGRKPCMNDGHCVPSKGTTFTCLCLPGHFGFTCQFDDSCHNHPCMNRGTCIRKGNDRVCKCQSQYSGTNCEKLQVAISPANATRNCTQPSETTASKCTGNPCRNGGTHPESGGNVTCLCSAGFTGVHCEDRVTGQEDGVTLVHSPLSQQPAPSLQPSVYIQPAQASVKQPPASSCSRQYCLNGGTCVQLASGIKCSCQYHFSGSRCQDTYLTTTVQLGGGVHTWYKSDVQDGCSKHYCYNGGTCKRVGNSALCRCRPQFSGSRCQVSLKACQPGMCGRHGTCLRFGNTHLCTCKPGYRGRHCQKMHTCTANRCQHGAMCQELTRGRYKCHCPPHYTGKQCEVALNVFRPQLRVRKRRDLQMIAMQSLPTPVLDGFTTVVVCTRNLCTHGATCVVNSDLPSLYTCQCTPGYTGLFCESSVKVSSVHLVLCGNRPCQNGGTCKTDAHGDSNCQCPPKFTGLHCELKTPTENLTPGSVHTSDKMTLKVTTPPVAASTGIKNVITATQSTSDYLENGQKTTPGFKLPVNSSLVAVHDIPVPKNGSLAPKLDIHVPKLWRQRQSAVRVDKDGILASTTHDVHVPTDGLLASTHDIHVRKDGILAPTTHDVHVPTDGMLASTHQVHVSIDGVLTPKHDIHVPTNDMLASTHDVHVPIDGMLASTHQVHVPIDGMVASTHQVHVPIDGVLTPTHDIYVPTDGNVPKHNSQVSMHDVHVQKNKSNLTSKHDIGSQTSVHDFLGPKDVNVLKDSSLTSTHAKHLKKNGGQMSKHDIPLLKGHSQILKGAIPAPKGHSQVPIGAILAPKGESHVPIGAIPAPKGYSQVPIGAIPAPKGDIQVPIGAIPIPKRYNQVPIGAIPIPKGDSEVPIGAIPVPKGDGQVPIGAIPVPKGDGQVSIGAIPVPKGDSEVPIGAIPIPKRGNQVPIGAIPILKGDSQVPIGAIPVPKRDNQVPIGAIPMPKRDNQVPIGAIPVPKRDNQVPIGAIPVPKRDNQVPIGAIPIPKRDNQVPIGAIPVPKGDSQVPIGAIPIPKGDSQVPIVGSQIPVDGIPVPIGGGSQADGSYVHERVDQSPSDYRQTNGGDDSGEDEIDEEALDADVSSDNDDGYDSGMDDEEYDDGSNDDEYSKVPTGQVIRHGGLAIGSAGQMPGSGGLSPGNGGHLPGSGGQSSGNGGQMPGSGGQSSGDGGQMPGSGGQSPGNGGQMLGSGGQSPGNGGQMPGSNGWSTGNGFKIPDSGGQSPTIGDQAAITGGESRGNSSEGHVRAGQENESATVKREDKASVVHSMPVIHSVVMKEAPSESVQHNSELSGGPAPAQAGVSASAAPSHLYQDVDVIDQATGQPDDESQVEVSVVPMLQRTNIEMVAAALGLISMGFFFMLVTMLCVIMYTRLERRRRQRWSKDELESELLNPFPYYSYRGDGQGGAVTALQPYKHNSVLGKKSKYRQPSGDSTQTSDTSITSTGFTTTVNEVSVTEAQSSPSYRLTALSGARDGRTTTYDSWRPPAFTHSTGGLRVRGNEHVGSEVTHGTAETVHHVTASKPENVIDNVAHDKTEPVSSDRGKDVAGVHEAIGGHDPCATEGNVEPRQQALIPGASTYINLANTARYTVVSYSKTIVQCKSEDPDLSEFQDKVETAATGGVKTGRSGVTTDGLGVGPEKVDWGKTEASCHVTITDRQTEPHAAKSANAKAMFQITTGRNDNAVDGNQQDTAGYIKETSTEGRPEKIGSFVRTYIETLLRDVAAKTRGQAPNGQDRTFQTEEYSQDIAPTKLGMECIPASKHDIQTSDSEGIPNKQDDTDSGDQRQDFAQEPASKSGRSGVETSVACSSDCINDEITLIPERVSHKGKALAAFWDLFEKAKQRQNPAADAGQGRLLSPSTNLASRKVGSKNIGKAKVTWQRLWERIKEDTETGATTLTAQERSLIPAQANTPPSSSTSVFKGYTDIDEHPENDEHPSSGYSPK